MDDDERGEEEEEEMVADEDEAAMKVVESEAYEVPHLGGCTTACGAGQLLASLGCDGEGHGKRRGLTSPQ